VAYLRSESEVAGVAARALRPPGKAGDRCELDWRAEAQWAPPSESASLHPLPPSAGTAALASAAMAKPVEMMRLASFTVVAVRMTASGYVLRPVGSASRARELQSARADIERAESAQKRNAGVWDAGIPLETRRLSERADSEVRRAQAAVPRSRNMARQGHGGCGDDRRQEHSSSPHDRLLQ